MSRKLLRCLVLFSVVMAPVAAWADEAAAQYQKGLQFMQLGKLDDAISHQQRVVSDSKQRTEQGQQAWVDQRNKVKAFDTLSHRHQSQQARKEAKQEQRLTDEHAAKQFRDRTEED